MNTCTATCTSGRSCTARARPNRPYCFARDPESAAATCRRPAGRGYGKATARRLACRMPATLNPVLYRLYTTSAITACRSHRGLVSGTDPPRRTPRVSPEDI
jgi:hypothetical protein